MICRTFCPPSVIQLAAADCCEMTADLSVYEKNMNLLYDGLTALGFEIVRPGGTFVFSSGMISVIPFFVFGIDCFHFTK